MFSCCNCFKAKIFFTKSIGQAEVVLPEFRNAGSDPAGAVPRKPPRAVWGVSSCALVISFPAANQVPCFSAELTAGFEQTLVLVADERDEGVPRAAKYLEKQGPKSYFFTLLSGGAQSRRHPLCNTRSRQIRWKPRVRERGGGQTASEPEMLGREMASC